MHFDHSSAAPLDALLASYAVGHVSRPLHALIASHLALSNKNRAFVSTMEQFAAAEMERSIPLAAATKDRDRRLASIFEEDTSVLDRPVAERPTAGKNDLLPAPLAAFIGKPFETINWQTVMPGLREVKLEDRAGCEASLLWIKAGRAMPSHTHPGIEATLVLKGSFTDSEGRFARGDLAVVDSAVDHKPVAGEEDDCICFAVSEGPVHLTGPLARIFNWMKRQ